MNVGLLLAGRTMLDDAPHAFLARAAAWFAAHCRETLIASVIDEEDGRPRLLLRLHPAAEDVAIVAAGQRRVVVAARTSGGGPGYHRYLCEVMRSFGETQRIEWTFDEEAGVGDPTGYFDGGAPEAVDRAMLAWLHETIARLGDGGALSMPAGYDFELGPSIATPLGPLDRATIAAITADPARGAVVFPWWGDGLTPRMLLDRARCRLWTDVRWRPPFFDSERESLRATAADLEAAWRAEPGLDFPWREWREVLAFLGIGGTVADEVRRRANESAAGAPTLGYRRGDVRVTLPGGWSMRVPGSLAESTSADGTWQAVDHRRRISFRSIEASSADDEMPAPEELLDGRPHPGDERLELSGSVRGRATLSARAGSGVLTALCAVPGRVAICTISFDDADDREWAIATWRSIENPAAALH